jgi:dolichol-phosphate mannosyltransferase
MISLGIIGTYIARIYEEVKGRPRYVVRDTCGVDRP